MKYMRDAIKSWSGQFHPEHPLFGWFNEEGTLEIRELKR